MNAALANPSDLSRVANEVIYLRSILQLLITERSDYAWLWEIRLKAIDFIVKRYDLESLADPEALSEHQMARLNSSSPLLQVAASNEAQPDSEEIRDLKQRVRQLFESVKNRIDS